MNTPNYVKEAVIAYKERNDIEPLVQMFEKGIPLHSYDESREIITNFMRGKANKKRGRPPLTRDKKASHYQILMRVAELYGAGLPLIHKGNNPAALTACGIAAQEFDMCADHVHDNIWKPEKTSDAVKEQMKLGGLNKHLIPTI